MREELLDLLLIRLHEAAWPIDLEREVQLLRDEFVGPDFVSQYDRYAMARSFDRAFKRLITRLQGIPVRSKMSVLELLKSATREEAIWLQAFEREKQMEIERMHPIDILKKLFRNQLMVRLIVRCQASSFGIYRKFLAIWPTPF